ncbi:DUF808 domain-containing protein [Cupriavidus basilensis]|uniref:DUF808 domain-containing protein n=1 Tax=Cupriavidus basilensis TaxID=68895 RepID=UPI00157A5555|nr:DUF808 domain-containing protein [Cupriavidus basilensis]NUA30731.1 DUF808 domain-containing protein [Cupriavidus basilensis]
MAGTSLLLLIDDITSILDDVATMSKVAAKKTAGVLGDDLALNAQQVSGVKADRELPVVWAVALGSLRNKVILVPAALAISATAPWAIVPLLMAGGAFLCYEGFEKIAHSFLHSESGEDASHAGGKREAASLETDVAAYEKAKIRGAVRTDFILSAEIIVISLGTVSGATFGTQVAVLSTIALIMTVGVYGLVAGIVKLDDAGLYLCQKTSAAARAAGRSILRLAPWLMRALSVVGTVAMFLVGGGILVHGIPAAHHLVEPTTEILAGVPLVGSGLGMLGRVLINALAGIVAGALVTAVVAVAKLGMRALRPSTE